MKRVLILNSSGGGHHSRYVRWILECEALQNYEVILAGPKELLDHPELSEIEGRFQARYVNVPAQKERSLGQVPSTAELVHQEFVLWKIWQETYNDVSATAPIDLVILPYMDDCLNAIALKGSPFKRALWMGISIRQMFHFARVGVEAPRPRLSAVRGWLFRRALHNQWLLCLFTIDPTLDEYANLYLHDSERKRLIFLPDPGVDHVLPLAARARDSLGIPQNAKVVLAYGALTERKGIRSLVESANNPQCPSNICVLLAGQQSSEISALLAAETASSLRNQNRLTIINRYISNSEEGMLLASADCLWTAYLGFFQMSGILVLGVGMAFRASFQTAASWDIWLTSISSDSLSTPMIESRS